MLLFTPGPTPIPESIRQAMATPTLHHRTKEFEEIFAKARRGLKTMLKMPEVLMLASSGTGAMEASILQFCSAKLLSINCGKFGERWGKIAAANSIPYVEIAREWNTPVEVEDVLQELKNDTSIDVVALQVCESAGGMRLKAEEIAKSIKAYNKNIVVIADAITAMGVEPLDTTNIDVLIGGSQKAFMLPPGMSILGLSEYALTIIQDSKSHKKYRNGLYFNLAIELNNQRKNTTAWTAPTTIISGLVKYFEIIQALGEGMELDSALICQNLPNSLEKNRLESGFAYAYNHTAKLALATREAIRELDLKVYPKTPALAMSTIEHKEQAAKIRQCMKTYGVNVAAGQDHIKEQIFRINHMGLVRVYEASFVVNALELSLNALGIRAFDGRGGATFLRTFYAL